ncbi:MAG: ROK family protein [Solirubrobacteraceae bacterium]|jgi:glucokinase|nr:ROK family protein [Solirubrobacteraceae bacterium]
MPLGRRRTAPDPPVAPSPPAPTPALRGGVDLGGTKIQALVLDEAHTVLGRARLETPREGGPEAVTGAVAAALGEALAAAGAEAGGLRGIGVGTPGAVDATAGTVANARNLPDWIEPYPFAAELSRRLADVPVALGNDVDVAIRGEHALGAGRGHDELLGVWWGTGVGGGLVLGGRMWAGRGFAGEFGHLVVRRGGALCGCGNRGCVEAYAGRKSMEAWVRRREAKGERTDLFRLMEKHDKDRLTSGIWWRAVRDEDPLALRAVERALQALGAGIASAVNLLDLPLVIIGGGMGDRFFATHGDQIAQYTHESLFRAGSPPAIVPGALGDDAGALGAALLLG